MIAFTLSLLLAAAPQQATRQPAHPKLDPVAYSGGTSSLKLCFVPPPGSLRWSDPNTWGGAVPAAGDCVTVPAGQTIYLDTNTASLAGVDVIGNLVYTCGNYELKAEAIRVSGKLQVGTLAHPFHHKATITLKATNACDLGARPCSLGEEQQTLSVVGNGLLRLIGSAQGSVSWTRLAATANAGSNQITLQTAPGWKKDQSIVIASTDYEWDQAEEHTIGAINGNAITLGSPLDHLHWGATEGTQYLAGGVEERAEVGLLSRNIVVRGTPADCSGATYSGHTILHSGSPTLEAQWVEFRDLGKEGVLARYPIHFHVIGSAAGSFVRNCSVNRSSNRVVSIHNTDDAVLEGNVGYDVVGHAYYMEEIGGLVEDCVLRDNLGIATKAAQPGLELNEDDDQPATFYLGHPRNTIEGNAAAGAAGYGFYMKPANGETDPPTSFANNVAHSNHIHGFYQNTRPTPEPKAVYTGLTAYKNRQYGMWLRSYSTCEVVDARVADNRGGFYLASEGFQWKPADYGTSNNLLGLGDTALIGGLVIGETDNVGEPSSCFEKLANRSLPQKYAQGTANMQPPWRALTGMEIYDGLVGVEGTTFAEFRPKHLSGTPAGCSATVFDREAGAIHQVRYNNPWAVDPRNYVTANPVFVNDATTITIPLYFRTPVGVFARSCNPGSTVVGDNGVANTIVQDLDGTLTGNVGSLVFPVNPFLENEIPGVEWSYDATWNANVTAGPPSEPLAQLELYSRNGTIPGWNLLTNPEVDTIEFQSFFGGPVFECAGPILNLCEANETRISRFHTQVRSTGVYDVAYGSAASSDWPRRFYLTLQFSEPEAWAGVRIPIDPAYGGTPVVEVNGAPAPAAPNLNNLLNGANNRYLYDTATNLLYVKIGVGGTPGGDIYAGERTNFYVDTP